MPVLFANSEQLRGACHFDIRVRVLISLAVSAAGLFLNQAGPLALLAALTFIYALSTRRYKLIAIAYLLVAVMSVLSIVMIYAFFQSAGYFLARADSPYLRMVNAMQTSMIRNFHIPFLRLIPSLNVLLAIVLDFQIQAFIAAMKTIRLPRSIFLPLTVFCRFIPEFIQNLRQLRDATRLRGFNLTLLTILFHPWLTLRLTCVPLVIRALRIADNLAMAAEMRRIGYASRATLWKPLRLQRRDFLLLGAAVLVLGIVIFWQLQIPPPPPTRGGMRP